MDFAPAPQLTTYRVFLSSADTPELRNLRDRFEAIIDKILRDQLIWANEPLRIETQRWETIPAQRTAGTPLERFVAAALESHLTIVLLVDEIRAGTKRELRAVLNNPEARQVAILRFTAKSKTDADGDELGRYLKGIRTRHHLIVKTLTTRLDSVAVWHEVIRTALAAVIAVYRAERHVSGARFNEAR